MMQVRPFTSGDIPRVAELFLKVFGKGALHPLRRDEVARALGDVFLDHPWRHEPLTSFVCETPRGAIAGFLGVTPRRMRFKGRSILVAVSAHLMVDPDERASLSGVQLQQALFAGPQDLAITDGATDQGLAIWTGLGGRVAGLPSMTWLRPLRPAALAVAMCDRSTGCLRRARRRRGRVRRSSTASWFAAGLIGFGARVRQLRPPRSMLTQF